VLIPALLGICLSFALYAYLERVARERLENAAQRAADSYTASFRLQTTQYLEELQALQRFLQRTPLVSQEDIAAFVGPLTVRHAEILTLAWVPRVAAADRSSYEAQLPGDSGADAAGFRELGADGRLGVARFRDE
jgi:hypothetical protein